MCPPNARPQADPSCAEPARVLDWRPGRRAAASPDADRYENAFGRARERALESHLRIGEEQSAALRAAERLLGEVPERRELLLRNRPRYGGWRLAAVLAEEAEQRLRGAPGEALRLAELAADVATALTGAPDGAVPPCGEALARDVAAGAWRALGDAQRHQGLLSAAGDSLARARRHLRRGTGEPLERAALLESTGRLLAARGRLRARRFLDGAAGLYCRLGETRREGRARVLLGLHLLDGEAAQAGSSMTSSPGSPVNDDTDRGLAELRQGLDLIDADAEPELFDAGRRRAAGRGDERSQARAAAAPGPAPPACHLSALSPLDGPV